MTILNDLPPNREMPARHAQARRRELEALLSRTSLSPTMRRRGLLLAATAVCAAGVATVVAINPWVRTPTASAAWAAVPTPLDAATTQQLGAPCADHLRRYFDRLDSWITAIGEQRGTVRAVLIIGQSSGSRRWGLCAPDLGVDGLVPAVPPIPGASLPRGIAVPSPSEERGPVIVPFDARTARIAVGAVPADVTRVVIETLDGRLVTASVGRGYCLAWWPSHAGIRAVHEYTGTGQELHQ
jgi:hypothetical protein